MPLPPKINKEVDIPGLLEDLGFVVDFVGPKGYMRLNHPDLILELLVPERGREKNKPYDLPELGMNAQGLRFLDFLAANTMEVEFNKMLIKVPHPAAFALHKLLIHKRRREKDKSAKDIQQALMLMGFILKKNDIGKLKRIFKSMLIKWQENVLDNLHNLGRQDVIDILSSK